MIRQYSKVLVCLTACLNVTLGPALTLVPEKSFFWFTAIAIAAVMSVLTTANATAGQVLTPPQAPAAPHVTDWLPPVWRGVIAGGLLYAIYQVVFYVQALSVGAALAQLGGLPDPRIGQAIMQSIGISSPLIVAVISLLLGATFIAAAANGLIAAAVCCVTVLVMAVTAQVLTVLAGRTDHLAMMEGVPLTDILQGFLMAWVIMSAPVMAGLAAARLATGIADRMRK